MPDELAIQTKNAFEFIQKLNFEISYLIKEFEGLLQQEKERFVICRPGGYGITAYKSTGLEPANVENWLYKNFTVCFVPEDRTKISGGQSITPLVNDLRVIVLHIELFGKHIKRPEIFGGYIKDINNKKQQKKFEYITSTFSYNNLKIFSDSPRVEYEDIYCSFTGEFTNKPLLSINCSEDVSKMAKDILALYRK